MNKDDELLLARIDDRIEQCKSRYMVTSSDFLDTHQRKLVLDHFMKIKLPPASSGLQTERYAFYGGYDDAERCIAVFLPDYVVWEEEAVPEAVSELLRVIKVSIPKGGRKLGHRDYLGSLLGLGLDRSVTGDILVREDGADIVVLEEIADFLELNYSKAGRTNLQISLASVGELDSGQVHTEELADTVASLRLDNIVSSAFRMSRGKAAEAIRAGLVSLNSMEAVKVDMEVLQGDKIVVRGRGRVILAEVGGQSRKGRIYVKYKVYL